MERTFVMVKPDAMARGLAGSILSRLEAKGLRLVACRLLAIPRDLAERHYAQHQGKPFYAGLIEHVTSGPVLAMVWEGPRAVAQVRTLMGATDPAAAAPGSIRGDWALDVSYNLVHGSDSTEAAAREIALFFADSDIVDWRRADETKIHS